MPSDPFYTSAAWKTARAAALDRVGHRCQHLGCGARASVVDHVTSRRAGGAPFAEHNLRPLCWMHHSAKTVRHDGGFGRAPSAAPAVSYASDARGMPLDPGHRWRQAVTKTSACAAVGA